VTMCHHTLYFVRREPIFRLAAGFLCGRHFVDVPIRGKVHPSRRIFSGSCGLFVGQECPRRIMAAQHQSGEYRHGVSPRFPGKVLCCHKDTPLPEDWTPTLAQTQALKASQAAHRKRHLGATEAGLNHPSPSETRLGWPRQRQSILELPPFFLFFAAPTGLLRSLSSFIPSPSRNTDTASRPLTISSALPLRWPSERKRTLSSSPLRERATGCVRVAGLTEGVQPTGLRKAKRPPVAFAGYSRRVAHGPFVRRGVRPAGTGGRPVPSARSDSAR
jgi:hypothetical protein